MLSGNPGNDALNGGSGADALHGVSGDDSIPSQDLDEAGIGEGDTVDCGPGRDRVTADLDDRVADDCERVVAGGI